MGKSIIFRSTLGVIAIAGLVLIFQNCGKAGFESADLGSVDSASVSDPNVPFPVDFNLNQIGMSSCPKAGENAIDADHLNNAYFSLRFGAYDNSTLPYSGATNIGGLRLRQEFLDYVKGTFGAVNPDTIQRALNTSAYMANTRLIGGVLAVNRSRDYLAFSALATPVLDVLASSSVTTELGNSSLTNSQTGVVSGQPISFFSQASYNLRALSGSLNFGKSENDVVTFQNEMINNHFLILGLTDGSQASASSGDLIKNLKSPVGDVTKSVFAKGYQLGIASKTNSSPAFLNNITEYDLSTTTPVNLTYGKGQEWSCLPLTIVRDIDRKYYKNGSTLIHKLDINNTYGAKVEYIFQSQAELNSIESQMNALNTSVNVTGTSRLCPVQSISSLSLAVNQEKLRVLRRFLPADLWEINTDYMCAVPTQKVFDRGEKCYASGDSDPKNFIQYNMTGCGPNGRECPAMISICTRTD